MPLKKFKFHIYLFCIELAVTVPLIEVSRPIGPMGGVGIGAALLLLTTVTRAVDQYIQ
jgi:hypothetical protein